MSLYSYTVSYTDPCIFVRCFPCKVDRDSGRAFCEPSCDINNGGCRDDQICKLKEVQCVTTPCPPQVECINFEEICSLEPEIGPCRALIPQYFHNATSGECEQFFYGGCFGNDNRFNTMKECEKACGKFYSLPMISPMIYEVCSFCAK